MSVIHQHVSMYENQNNNFLTSCLYFNCLNESDDFSFNAQANLPYVLASELTANMYNTLSH